LLLPSRVIGETLLTDAVCHSAGHTSKRAAATTLNMQAIGVPDAVIIGLLGKGWSYTDWQKEIERLGYTWNEGLRLRIIKKEYLLFKSEIGQLLSQPNTSNSLKSRSNSFKSIIKRIKGKTGERDQRLQEGKLFGSDAK
jgi:hypothetical protein